MKLYSTPQDLGANHIDQIYSGITSGRVLNGELLYTKILEVNLFERNVYGMVIRSSSPHNL